MVSNPALQKGGATRFSAHAPIRSMSSRVRPVRSSGFVVRAFMRCHRARQRSRSSFAVSSSSGTLLIVRECSAVNGGQQRASSSAVPRRSRRALSLSYGDRGSEIRLTSLLGHDVSGTARQTVGRMMLSITTMVPA